MPALRPGRAAGTDSIEVVVLVHLGVVTEHECAAGPRRQRSARLEAFQVHGVEDHAYAIWADALFVHEPIAAVFIHGYAAVDAGEFRGAVRPPDAVVAHGDAGHAGEAQERDHCLGVVLAVDDIGHVANAGDVADDRDALAAKFPGERTEPRGIHQRLVSAPHQAQREIVDHHLGARALTDAGISEEDAHRLHQARSACTRSRSRSGRTCSR